ncbi:MAG TPA: HAMP domain-containing protein, partial [Pyrinomonadaceae bacterium]|nr:HAMP domain-containing protein [Pyrinomonadaceae bacterium]
MNLRAKLLLLFVVGSLAPFVLVGVLLYRNSAETIEGMLREDVEQETARIAGDVEAALREQEIALEHLARSDVLRESVAGAASRGSAAGKNDAGAAGESAGLSDAARSVIFGFISRRKDYYSSITFVGAGTGGVPVRIEPPAPGGVAPRVTTDLMPGQLHLDERVWTSSEQKPFRSNIRRGSTDTPCVVYTLPVYAAEVDQKPRAALVAELELAAPLRQAGKGLVAPVAAPANGSTHDGGVTRSQRMMVALDGAGQIIYHTTEAIKYQSVAAAMPYFEDVAREMQAGKAGTSLYNVPSDGSRWLVSYRPVGGLNLAVAVAGSDTRSMGGLRRNALVAVGLASVVALAAILLSSVLLRRTTRSIERVTEAAAAIAAGNLNQSIETRAGDETHALAESFNQMSARLREQIAKEAESRQFQSFVRLSAMLTHDLKNAITGLSMLVKNMERQFHREEFRADAVTSIKQATEKLGAIIARLSEPVKSLSGEYRRRPQPADLAALIRRVMAATAEPSAHFYEIETELPDSLVVPVDVERMERVIENLIVNAFEAMGAQEGGRLTVAAGRESESLVYFSVADTGPGMTKEFIDTRLFRAFATTKKR